MCLCRGAFPCGALFWMSQWAGRRVSLLTPKPPLSSPGRPNFCNRRPLVANRFSNGHRPVVHAFYCPLALLCLKRRPVGSLVEPPSLEAPRPLYIGPGALPVQLRVRAGHADRAGEVSFVGNHRGTPQGERAPAAAHTLYPRQHVPTWGSARDANRNRARRGVGGLAIRGHVHGNVSMVGCHRVDMDALIKNRFSAGPHSFGGPICVLPTLLTNVAEPSSCHLSPELPSRCVDLLRRPFISPHTQTPYSCVVPGLQLMPV